LCGVSYLPEDGQSYADGLAAAERRYNGLDMLRIFEWEPSPWPGRAGDFGGTVVLSMKLKPKAVLAGKHDAAVRSWFQNAPRDQDIYWSLHHEPEDNLEKGEFTSEEYKAAWRRLAAMADATGNPRLRATLILMDWTLDPRSGRDWRDFYAGDDVIDVLAFDVYNHGYKDDPPQYLSAEYQLRYIVDLADRLNKPFGIAELGSVLIEGDRSGEGRAAWLRDMIGYLDKHDALWVSYFDIDHAENADYRLRDEPSVAVWREFCS